MCISSCRCCYPTCDFGYFALRLHTAKISDPFVGVYICRTDYIYMQLYSVFTACTSVVVDTVMLLLASQS